MFAADDTIVAIATPPGPGGIGVVRLSGPLSTGIANTVLRHAAPLEPRRATVTEALDPDGGAVIDRVIVTYFPRPASYTGEDVVEVSGHGNPVLLRQIVSVVIEAGARLAEPGEFTFRAYLNGRINLPQAEAVADLADAVTPRQARAAFDQLEGTMTSIVQKIDQEVFDLISLLEASLDFPEEGYHFVDEQSVASETTALSNRISQLLVNADQGRLLREGCHVAIVGKPNVGKSTLFNALCGAPRAIVTNTAGTTRDLLTEKIDLGGIPITLVDTAGIHETQDPVEAEGVDRAHRSITVADAVVVVLDGSCPIEKKDRRILEDTKNMRRLLLVSKRDLPSAWVLESEPGVVEGDPVFEACLLSDNQTALEGIRDQLISILENNDSKERRDIPAVTNLRHITLLKNAKAALVRAASSATACAAEELVITDLQEARSALEEISGKRTPDAVIERIFERFCIGK